MKKKVNDLELLERVNQLIIIYGSLLTDKQKAIMEDYYVYNLSISEISINHEISRAAVNDCLKKSLHNLEDFEKKLHLLKKSEKLQELLKKGKENKLTSEELIKSIERMMEDGI